MIKNTKTITALWSFIFVILFSGVAFSMPLPNKVVSIDTENITLGDVFQDITENAYHVLAPAPRLGKSMILSTNDLERISKAFKLGWKSNGAYYKTIITRSETLIKHTEIVAQIRKNLSQELYGQSFDLTLSNKNLALTLPSNLPHSFQVSDFIFDPVQNTFSALVSAPANTENPYAKKHISGHVFKTIDVPVLSRRISKGELIQDRDIDVIHIRETKLTSQIIMDKTNLIGKTPRHGVNAMRPISSSDIQAPVMVHKGDTVTIKLNKGVLKLTMQGRAMDNGAKGDNIRILNTKSHKIIEASVSGYQNVTIN